jgi:hypothetical protein
MLKPRHARGMQGSTTSRVPGHHDVSLIVDV